MLRRLLVGSAVVVCAIGALALPSSAQDADADGALDAGDNCPQVWNRTQDDRDADGVGDVCDNCRFAANATQSDVGGFGTLVGDGVGDVCQCGDVRPSGRTDVVDLTVLRRHLSSLPTGAITPQKCPVTHPGGACDSTAVQELRSALTLPARELLQVCEAAVCGAAPCGPGGALCPSNAIASENREDGVPASEWDVAGGADDANLLGFATDISYAPGETVQFKVHAALLPDAYTLTIYRVGWYRGDGARRIASLVQNDPVSQATCQSLTDPADCSNWSVTDTWTIPAGQVSGVYLAKLLPSPAGGSNGSHILFVIRDDVGGSDLLFQTADPTWMAYNPYPSTSIFGAGTNTSLYNGAAHVSYDRPHRRAVAEYLRSFWGAQLHLVRYLERNGYDVSYFAGADAARRGAEIAEHRVWISSGHDEYWSREMRDAVNAARDSGTHLIFLSGNLMFWKTRWEDGFRTIVGYKTATHANADDPDALTSTWRDVRFEKPGDLAEPENSTTGLIFGTNGYNADSMKVPREYGALRLWRNTAAAAAPTCNVTQLAPLTVGFEWDHDQDNGHRPDGLFRMSSTNIDHAPVMYGAGSGAAGGTFAGIGQATHHIAAYRAPSGALVFNSGSVQWSHGLDRTHLSDPAYRGYFDVPMMQATANLLADMGVQAATPIDFCPATTSSDTTPPNTGFAAPAPGATLRVGEAVEIRGNAGDAGGQVAGVEVSLDGGATWQRAEGRASWHYAWRPSEVGAVTLQSRAVDDSGNLEGTPASLAVGVGCASPCSVWPSSAAPAVPRVVDAAVELGVRFRADVDGSVRAIRFWADALSAGTHPVHLWSADGTLLASAVEPAAPFSGWHEAVFPAPVAISANTTYTASYHTSSGYAYTLLGLDDAWYRQPLAALAVGGRYTYGPSGSFPTSVFQNANYFVDVDFVPSGSEPRRLFHAEPTPAVPNNLDPGAAADPWGVELGVQFRASVDGVIDAIHFYRADDTDENVVNLWRDIGASHPIELGADLPGGAKGLSVGSGKTFAGTGTGWIRVPLAQPVPILAGATYVASYHARSRYAYTAGYFGAPVADPPLVAERSLYRYGKTAFPELSAGTSPNYWIDVEFRPSAPAEQRMWTEATVPATPFFSDSEVELGVRFTSEVDGFIDGVRYYKHPSNTGAHSATLWSDAGAELATTAFAGESSCGWQETRFAAPVPVTAGTIYVASYHTTAGYAVQHDYFGSWSPPLRAVEPAEGSGTGNGVYLYGPRAFPNQSFAASNYFVDVIFRARATPVANGPTRVPAHPLP